MKHFARFASLAFALLFVTGCATHKFRASPVLFYDVENRADPETRTALYLDQYGDLYADTDQRRFGPDGQAIMPEMIRCGFNAQLCSTDDTHILSEDSQDVWSKWRGEQNERWEQTADRIIEAVRDGEGSRPIVFLIHGFRVKDASKDYNTVQSEVDVLGLPDVDPHYVEVSWDGREKSTDLTIPSSWLFAQWSGPQTGLRLRRLINLIDRKHKKEFPGVRPKIRILTHSSGAFVAGAIVGDTGSALPCFSERKFKESKKPGDVRINTCSQSYLAFEHKRASTDVNDLDAVPQIPDIRIGMLAAATTNRMFLEGSRGRYLSGQGLLTPPDTRLILAYNPYDVPVRKGPAPTAWLGESGLGVSRKMMCGMAQSFKETNRTHIILTDHNRRGVHYPRRGDHDFDLYVRQPEFDVFARALLADPPPEATGPVGCRARLKAWKEAAKPD